jgi:uncharacterized membrane protein
MDDQGQSSLGYEEGVVATVSYFGFLGVVILMLERKSNFVRFHALQSSIGFGMLAVYWLIVKWISSLEFLAWSPGLLALIFSIYMMIKAYHGEEYKVPIIGDLAFGAVYDTSPEPEEIPAAATGEPNTTAAEGK